MANGTYREADGSPVDVSEAQEVWVAAARPVLIRTAERYHELIRHRALADEIQTETGVHTKSLLQRWISEVLGDVARDCHEKGEPLLSALCVKADGTVGDAYGAAVADTYGEPPSDLEMHAAAERLKCYEFFGAKLPAGGGVAALPKEEAGRRARAKRSAQAERKPKMCPTCHNALPLTGQCDHCAGVS